nr:MAG TPA: hypothetical protein [Caudoviricetes sp.]
MSRSSATTPLGRTKPHRQQKSSPGGIRAAGAVFFSDPVILPQIIPNCHNRILTPLHAILYFHSYNPLKRTQNVTSIAQRRGKVLYTRFAPYACARVYSGRGCMLYNTVPYHRPPPAAADHGQQQQTGQHHHQQQPPAADSHAPTSATQDRPGQTRRGEGRGVARRGLFPCSGTPCCFAERFTEQLNEARTPTERPNNSPNDSVNRADRPNLQKSCKNAGKLAK